jgi:broad specificity phosphatase PhoE
MTLERVAPVLDEIVKPSIVVAHGAVGRGVRKHLLGLSEEDAAWFVFPQDKVFRFVGQVEELI